MKTILRFLVSVFALLCGVQALQAQENVSSRFLVSPATPLVRDAGLIRDAGPPLRPAKPKKVDDRPRTVYHWKGLLLQSLAFDSLQNSVRLMTANQYNRHLLLNKPYWSDYAASLGQFNWRRWNDGDSLKVNYIGHPMEGAIAGYLEIQNNPRDRALRIGKSSDYWYSRLRSFTWSAVYSTQWELGPLGESAIFNQGGYTYPIQCQPACSAHSKFTNNTGWVDLTVTPVIGTLWLIGEDTLDKLVTDPLVHRHPGNFGFLLLRSGANPSRSMANMLRGRYPWYRDYEHPGSFESGVARKFNEALEKVPQEHMDIFLYFAGGSFSAGGQTWTHGGGAETGIRIARYLDFTAEITAFPTPDLPSGPHSNGTPIEAAFGLRSGYSGRYLSLKAGLAPGFVSYTRSDGSSSQRATNFQCLATLDTDVKLASHLATRITVQNTLIRYQSDRSDLPGIAPLGGQSFLAPDNFINSTNWGLKVGPVFRF